MATIGAHGITSRLPDINAEVVRRRLAFDADPTVFRRAWDAADRREGERIARAQQILPTVEDRYPSANRRSGIVIARPLPSTGEETRLGGITPGGELCTSSV